MLNFIKNIIENPEKSSENEKLEMLKKVAEKKVTAEEVAEIIKFIKRNQAIKVEIPKAIDMAGTGGSGLPRINTTTLACLKLAEKGIKIAKHGNNASSGRFGSFDLIENLGYKISEDKKEILDEIEKNNVAFLYAKKFYPFFKHFGIVRQKYGKPTIFNILGPLLNPANTDFQIIGCSFEDKMELIIKTCKILGRKNVLVVRGEDGLDEITLSGKTKVYELKNGEIKNYYITPEEFGFKTCKLEEILTEKIEDKINIARKIISGEKIGRFNDLVDLNVEVALKFINKKLM